MNRFCHRCCVGLLICLSVVLLGQTGHAARILLSPDPTLSAQLFPETQRSIEFWQDRIRHNPQSYLDYLLLSQSYLQRARETGDVSNYVKAEAAVRQAAAINPKYREVQPLLAQILYSLHDFNGALEVAQSAVESGPLRALATLGDVYQALGRYDEAADIYQQWAAIKPSPALYSRLAALKDATGEFEEARILMERAAIEAYSGGYYGESLAWHEFQLGELYWKANDWDEAEQHFQTALEIYPDYYLALAGLGRVAAARKHYDQAITYYTQATDQIPQPDLLAQLGDLYMIVGDPEQAEQSYATVEFIGQLAEINQQVYNRQLVMFYADHDRQLEQALTLAKQELEVRQDLLGWDAAAWTYFKNGQIDSAQQAIHHALECHPHYAPIYYHAGLIAQAQGDTERARELLDYALSLHPAFDPLQAPRAQQILTELNQDPDIERPRIESSNHAQ